MNVFWVSKSLEKNVFRLEVSVDDSARVNLKEAIDHVLIKLHVHLGIFSLSPMYLDEACEIATVAEFLDNNLVAGGSSMRRKIVLETCDILDDVRVIEFCKLHCLFFCYELPRLALFLLGWVWVFCIANL